jgi:tetratricopeptide (TPR) repeat protein/DNA-binding MarR family transcriptional regulator
MSYLRGHTVNERVLLHLGDYTNFMEHFVLPYPVTQNGIAEAVGIARPNVARTIKNLKDKELIFENKARIEKLDRRRKAYFLTDKGIQELRSLENKKLFNEKIFTKIPVTLDFVGRSKELRRMKTWEKSSSKVLIVEGVLGIGKSSLVSKFSTNLLKRNFIFWHSVKKTDTVREILSTFGDYLYMKKNNVLRYYLSSHININEDEVVKILVRNLSNDILIFDDCEKMSEDVNNFLNKIMDLLNDMNEVKMIFITEDEVNLTFKGHPKDFVQKLKLGGVEKGDIEELLNGKKISENIYELTKGHPLFLKLVRVEGKVHGDIQTHLKDYIKADLSNDERKLMEIASTYRLPFKASALFLETGLDYEVMTQLKSKYLLTEVSNDYYVVHDLIKNHFYSSLAEPRKKSIHTKIAKHYLDVLNDLNSIEAMYHYVAAKNYGKAADIAISKGTSLIEKGCYLKFETTLEEVVKEKVKDTKLAEIYVLRGHLQKVKGSWTSAIKYYQSALKIYEKHNLNVKNSDTLRMIGNVHRDNGDYPEALKKFNLALKLVKESESEVVSKIYDDIGTVRLRTGEVDKAGKEILKGVKIAKRLANDKQIALNNHTLGNFYLCKEEWDKARQIYRDCADVFESFQNFRMLAVCYNNLAITYYKTNDVKKAINFWKKSLSISEKIGDITVMMSYVNLGFITYKSGGWDQTELYCQKALEISESIGNALVTSAAYSILGHININRRNFPECIEYYEKALGLREKEGDKSKIISSNNDLAHAHLINRNTKKGVENAKKALKMAEETGNKEEWARAHLNFGNGQLLQNNLKEAKNSLTEAMKITKQIKNKSLLGKIYRSIGDLYIEEKEYLAAESHLTDSVQIFEDSDDRYELALSYIHLARSFNESGNEEPTSYFEKGQEILQSLDAERASA